MRILYIIVVIQFLLRGFQLESFLVPIQFITFVLILSFIILNKKQLSIVVVGSEAILNYVTMILNNGKMPVNINYQNLDLRHSDIIETTKLKIFSDIIFLRYPLNIGMIAISIGDLIVLIGLTMLIVQLIAINKK